MSFVIGNTLHTTPEGHLIEFDVHGSIIGTVNPESLSLAARSAFSQYQQVYRESQLALPQPGETRAGARRRDASDRRRQANVRDAAWAVERAIWHSRTRAAVAGLVAQLTALEPGWIWDDFLTPQEPGMGWYGALGDPQGRPVPLRTCVFMGQVVLTTLDGMPAETLVDAAVAPAAPTVRALHDAAMDRAERNLVAKHTGSGRKVDDLIGAWRDEARAAAIMLRQPVQQAEPTRSILCSSAAFCALDCSFFDAADTLIRAGLAGRPDDHTRMRLEEAQADLDRGRARWAGMLETANE